MGFGWTSRPASSSAPQIDRGYPPLKKKILALVLTGFSVLVLWTGCRPPQTVLSPVPQELREIEGRASLKLTRNGETAKARFSFVLDLPERGKIEVADILGGTVAEIYLQEYDAYFVLPGRKIYWQGGKEECLEKFLGFRISLREMSEMLCGRWTDGPSKDAGFEDWTFERDSGGKIISGAKADVFFRVKEFFSGSGVPRKLVFNGSESEGSIMILALAYNKPLPVDIFSLDFLKKYSPRTWEEIETMLRHES